MLVEYFSLVFVVMLSFLHYAVFSCLLIVWDLLLYAEELMTLFWSYTVFLWVARRKKKRKPVNFIFAFVNVIMCNLLLYL